VRRRLLTYSTTWRAIRIAFEVRALREKKGLSQRQLAESIGTRRGKALSIRSRPVTQAVNQPVDPSRSRQAAARARELPMHA
jgi:hypothetical protein